MRRPHLRILLAVVAVSITAPAGATDWYAVGDAPGGLGLMYIDKDSVHVLDGGVARGTIYLVFHPAARGAGAAAHEYDMEVDCAAPRGRMFRQRYYDADDHLTREHDGSGNWNPLPGEAQDRVRAFICSGGTNLAATASRGAVHPLADANRAFAAEGRTAK